MGMLRKYAVTTNVAYIVHGYVLTFMDEDIHAVPGQDALDRYVELCREHDEEVSTILCGEEVCLIL